MSSNPVRIPLALLLATTIAAYASTARSQTAPQRPGPSIAASASQQGSSFYVAVEQRISKLEVELQKANARVAALEGRFAQHVHEVPITEVGFLSEPINGRRVPLAISPKMGRSRSGPPIN